LVALLLFLILKDKNVFSVALGSWSPDYGIVSALKFGFAGREIESRQGYVWGGDLKTQALFLFWLFKKTMLG
jgi:hypothetical protein